LEWPVGEEFLERLDHGGAIEVAADRYDEIGGVEPAPVEGLKILALQGVDAARSDLARGPELRSVAQALELATFNGRGIIVALLQCLKGLLALQFQFVGLESGLGEHFAQEGHSFGKVLGEEVQAHRAQVVGDRGAHLGGQEGQSFVQRFGGLRSSAASYQKGSGESRQSFLTRRIQIGSGAHQNGHGHQRQFPIRNHVGHGA